MTGAGRRAGSLLLAAAVLVALAGCDPAGRAASPEPSPSGGSAASSSPDGPGTTAGPGATAPPVTLAVTEEGGKLRVTADGLPARENVEVLPCAAELVEREDLPADGRCSFNSGDGAVVRTDAGGALRSTVDPAPFLKINGHEFLCDSECVLGVVVGGQDVEATASYELPGDEVPEAPALTVESWEYDAGKNRGTAVVVGSGFEPGADVDLSQCPVAEDGHGVDGADCLYEYGTAAVAGDDGTFRVDVAAFPLFQRTDGERADEYVDCAKRPEICAVAAPWVVGERIAVTTLDTAPAPAGR